MSNTATANNINNNKKPTKIKKQIVQPKYTVGEEIFNSITHWSGVLLGIVFIVVSCIMISSQHSAKHLTGCLIFGISTIILYSCSAMYHSLPQGRAKRIFRIFDHCTIFLLIAGTYTPFCLITFDSLTIGTVIFAIQWGLTIIGITFNAINMNWKAVKILSMVSYVVMGWCIVFTWNLLVQHLSALSLGLLITGGIMYTVGLTFYGGGKKIKYFHSIWHIFVLLGTIAHIFSVLAIL